MLIRWSIAAALLAGICFWWFQQSAPVTPPVADNHPVIHEQHGKSLAQNQQEHPVQQHIVPGNNVKTPATPVTIPSGKNIPSGKGISRDEQQLVAYTAVKAQLPANTIITKEEIPLSSTLVAYTNIRPNTDYNLPVDEFNTLEDLIEQRLANSAKQVLVEENAPVILAQKERFRVKDIGLLAVRAYNKATGSDVKVKRRYDNDGHIVSVGVVSASASFEMYRTHR